MHISVMTWSNLTAKIYYKRDSEKMPLISYFLTSFSLSEYLLHQWSPWSFSFTVYYLQPCAPTDGITTVEYKKAGSNVHLKQ